MKNLIQIGKLVAIHGLKGEMIVAHHLGHRKKKEEFKVLFLEMVPGSYLPFFIKEIRTRNENEWLVLFEEVDNPEKARLYLQKNIWIGEEDFKKRASSKAPISLLGFHIISNKEDLGEVVEVIEQPMQVLCKIIRDGKEILIPLHEDSLKKIDRKNERVYVELPDGLLDIFD